jgi:hypothetical protein
MFVPDQSCMHARTGGVIYSGGFHNPRHTVKYITLLLNAVDPEGSKLFFARPRYGSVTKDLGSGSRTGLLPWQKH